MLCEGAAYCGVVGLDPLSRGGSALRGRVMQWDIVAVAVAGCGSGCACMCVWFSVVLLRHLKCCEDGDMHCDVRVWASICVRDMSPSHLALFPSLSLNLTLTLGLLPQVSVTPTLSPDLAAIFAFHRRSSTCNCSIRALVVPLVVSGSGGGGGGVDGACRDDSMCTYASVHL